MLICLNILTPYKEIILSFLFTRKKSEAQKIKPVAQDHAAGEW